MKPFAFFTGSPLSKPSNFWVSVAVGVGMAVRLEPFSSMELLLVGWDYIKALLHIMLWGPKQMY